MANLERGRLYYGIPEATLDPSKHDAANYAIALHRELSNEIPDLPRQMVVVGDNWQQACETLEGTPQPKSGLERMVQIRSAGRGFAWPTQERGQSAGFENILQHLTDTIPNPRERGTFFTNLTVVDATSSNPLSLNDIDGVMQLPWGFRGHFQATDIFVVRADYNLSAK